MKLWLPFLAVLILASLLPQSALACGGVPEAVKAEGWKVPDVASMRKTEIKGPDGLPVKLPNATAFVPKGKMYFDFIVPVKDDNATVQRYSVTRLPVVGVLRYEVNQRVVAYYIIFGNKRKGVALGCTRDAAIYDNDGDGVFETYQAWSGMPHIPVQ